MLYECAEDSNCMRWHSGSDDSFNTDRDLIMLLPYFYDRQWGFVDETGCWQIKPVYSYAQSFSEGLAIVRDKNGNWGAIDERGKEIIPFVYRELEPFWGGFAVGHRFGFSEPTGIPYIEWGTPYAYYDSWLNKPIYLTGRIPE